MRSYFVTPATRALTPTGGFLGGFSFSLNPYVGCAFGAGGGCPFCYVRALPVARMRPGAWGSWVIAKSNLLELLARELESLERAGKLRRTAIFMSSATDPYQGMERRMRLTRGALELMAERPPRRVLLQTRSPMIERDLDMLARLGERLVASITVETDDERVRRRLTPTSPSIARRLATARRLRAAGVYVQIAVAPMMPNNPARLAALVEGAADRVVVDTYFDGDGSGGRRSRALGMGELYRRLGYERWFEPGAERELMDALRKRLGHERVLFSRAGFNAV
jgi:DNA repair photolyase